MQRLTREGWITGVTQGEINLHTVNNACGFATYPHWSGFKDRQIDYFVLYMLLRGTIRATFHETSQRVTVDEGNLLIVSPQVRHSLRPAEPDAGITTYHFRFYAETHDRERSAPCDDFLFASFVEHRSLQRDIARLYDLIRTPSPYAQAQTQALWILIFTELFDAQTAGKASTFTPEQRAILDQFIARHIHQRPTPHDLADQLGYSRDYFSRNFKKVYGVSPRRWIVLERVRYASAMLLETQKTITQIASDLGYKDVYLFSRQFKSVQDCSPQAYRLKYSR